MDGTALVGLPPGVSCLILTVLMYLAVEAGAVVGRWAKSRPGGVSESQVATLEAAVLGILGLALGFTFSMALARFEDRRQLVVTEANAIGTTYLRSKMLPQPHNTQVADLLRRYVDIRVELYKSGSDPDQLGKATAQSEKLQNEIWSHAVAAGKSDPHSITTGLFVQTLNDMIDTQAERLAAVENQVPPSVFDIIYFDAILAMSLVGFAGAISGRKSILPTMAAVLLIASIVFLIADLDRPQLGYIRVSQQSIIRLHDSMERDAREASPTSTPTSSHTPSSAAAQPHRP